MPKLIQRLMDDFRIADRDLFNRNYRIEDPWGNQDTAWALLERFNDFEIVLFQRMVSEKLNVELKNYGETQEDILLNSKSPTSALINREVDSGYWDYPSLEIPPKAEIRFISYFDWDAISMRENKFIRVHIESCAINPLIVGKHALVNALGVSYYLRGS